MTTTWSATCTECGWESADFPEEWKADSAGMAHAENTHGVEAHIITEEASD